MRIAIMAVALGVVLGVPGVAPETMVPAAQAQASSVDALQTEILNAPDMAAVNAIIARENAAGNFGDLAEALAGASEARAATDVQGAATLVQLAITAADNSGDDDAQIIVGLAASAVASTADSLGLTAEADAIETATNNSSDPDVATAYVVAGGKNATPIVTTDTGGPTTPTTPTTTTGDDTTTTTGDDTTTTTGDTTTPTPDTGSVTPPPRPPSPPTPVVPTVPEPNPVQVVDPITVVVPPTTDDVGSPT